jgi:hypothetical protein
MNLVTDYTRAMMREDLKVASMIEQETGLYGYPPELVSVGLAALDSDKCPYAAIDAYTANADDDK